MKQLLLLLCVLAIGTNAQVKHASALNAEDLELTPLGGESINADFRMSQQVAVEGTRVLFTDMSTENNTNIDSWSWDFDGDGDEDSDEQSPEFQFLAEGHYLVTLTVSAMDLQDQKSQWVSVISSDIDSSLSYIPFTGKEAENKGIAAWNAETHQSEPVRYGHALQMPPASIAVAYYYIASRDYSNIDASSTMGMSASDTAHNWPNLKAALALNGKSIDDLEISFGLSTLGDDTEGQDWTFDIPNAVETRDYNDGVFAIRLNGEDMISGVMPQINMTLEYYAYNEGTDKIYGHTNFSEPVNSSLASSPTTQNIAAAFMADCGSDSLMFVFSSLQTANQFEFRENGRWGGFFDVEKGFLVKENSSAYSVDLQSSTVDNTSIQIYYDGTSVILTAEEAIQRITIYNIRGQEIQTMRPNHAEVSISNLPAGLCIVKCLTNNNELVQKVIIK